MTESRKLGSAAGNRGKGRKRGVPNKVTGALKDMILGALDRAGGVDYLEKQADENPVAFMTLVGKVLPLQVNAKVDGEVSYRIIERRVV